MELEKRMNDIMNKQNQMWVTALKDAEKTGEGVDLSEAFSKYSDLVQEKDKAFLEAEVRLGKKTSRGLFK